MTINASINVTATVKETLTADYKDTVWNATITNALAFTDGTTANKCDLIFVDEREVASATNDDLDLAGSLESVLGTAFTPAEIVAIIVVNAPISGDANTTDLTIGGASNAFEGFVSSSGTIGPIKPGGTFVIGTGDAAGIGTVTAGTGDILRIANSSGATATYQIAILGRSA